MESEQQWRLVAEMLAEIRNNTGSSWSESNGTLPDRAAILERLERSWVATEPPYPDVPREVGPRVAEHVLNAIDAHVLMGYYPPPELLLALSALLSRYMDAAGKLTLEEVMFGKPKRRTGCYAARSQKPTRDMWTDALCKSAAHKGKPEADVASLLESFSSLVFRRADAESLLRAKRRAKAKKRTE